jgi:hypothetical protein
MNAEIHVGMMTEYVQQIRKLRQALREMQKQIDPWEMSVLKLGDRIKIAYWYGNQHELDVEVDTIFVRPLDGVHDEAYEPIQITYSAAILRKDGSKGERFVRFSGEPFKYPKTFIARL